MLQFSKQITLAIKQNLKGVENKKVLINSKLKKIKYENYFEHELDLKPSLLHLNIKPLTLSRIDFGV